MLLNNMQVLSQKFKIKKSFYLSAIFLLVHSGAAISICFIEFILWGKIALIICFLLNLIFVTNHYTLLTSPNAIVEFWRNSVGDWCLKKRSGIIENGSLFSPIFISSQLIVLNFISNKRITQKTHFLNNLITLNYISNKTASSKISLTLARDSFYENDDFRKLKMLLKVIK
jgi:hypothetical protein